MKTMLAIDPIKLALLLPHLSKQNTDIRYGANVRECLCIEPSGVAVATDGLTLAALPNVALHESGPVLTRDLVLHAIESRNFLRLVNKAATLRRKHKAANLALEVDGELITLHFQSGKGEKETAVVGEGSSYPQWRQMVPSVLLDEAKDVRFRADLIGRFSIPREDGVARGLRLHRADSTALPTWRVCVQGMPELLGVLAGFNESTDMPIRGTDYDTWMLQKQA